MTFLICGFQYLLCEGYSLVKLKCTLHIFVNSVILHKDDGQNNRDFKLYFFTGKKQSLAISIRNQRRLIHTKFQYTCMILSSSIIYLPRYPKFLIFSYKTFTTKYISALKYVNQKIVQKF